MSVLIEFRHLKYIVAIAETGNITRAAEKLFIAQPALSRQIKELEDDIGFPIFIRNREGVHVTAAGQMVVSYARDALRAQAETIQAARAIHRGEVPALRLGFSSFVQQEILQSFCEGYAELFPGCQTQLSGGDVAHILKRLANRSLDGALLPMPIPGDGWAVEKIAGDPLVVCMRTDDPLAQDTEVQSSEISERLKVFPDPEIHPAAHDRLMEMLAEIGIRPEIFCFAATPVDIQWLVKAGYGLALINQKTTLDSGVTTRPIAGLGWTADTAFVHRAGAEHLALPVVIRHLRNRKGSKLRMRSSGRKEANQLQLELRA